MKLEAQRRRYAPGAPMPHHATLPRPRHEGPCTECGTALKQSQTPVPVTLSVDTADDRLVVTVSGELDLESDQVLQQTLSDALDHAAGGLELDLAGVDFCDCSALNALLRVRHRALQTSKSLILCATSPAVERLLDLTSTLPLFTTRNGTAEHLAIPSNPAHTKVADPADSAVDEQAADTATAGHHTPPSEQPPQTADSSSDNQAAEIAQLRRALQTHPAIDIARGILMASFQLTIQQSWQVLVAASQRSNIKLHLIADALLQAIDGQAMPEPLAGHLARAVQVHGTPDTVETSAPKPR
ncbi:anti-sigma factor antagonist [Streptomyces sp. NPDC019443]|uniref:anti-sigma factor antagonist n=1 Tax=Streptomyces sp. NPDC019443 TaxID=3365061 RepID=UPI0037B9455D